MKINFATILTQLNGEPITNEKQEPFSLGQAAVNALLQPMSNVNPMEKIRRARLAERAFDQGEVEISPEDLTLIRQCIGELYAPLIVMKAYRLLGDDGGDNVMTFKAV